MKMKDPYNAYIVKVGDVMAYTIKFHVNDIADDGTTIFISVYKCPWAYPELDNGIPQGMKISMTQKALISIFPILNNYDYVFIE